MLNSYRGKRILVTGHTGFKGSWLTLWLLELGAEVIGYSLQPPSTPNLFQCLGLEGDIEHHHGDIRDYEHLERVFQKSKPDMVFHLAAQSLVRLSYREPRLTYETNVTGTVNVLEAVRQTETVRTVINVTSDKCYENREWVWGYRENDPMGGRDPYSSSKGCAELVSSAYLHSFFAPDKYGQEHQVALVSVRAGNVIGGGDWGDDRLLPDCVRALHRGEEIVIRFPHAIRPWQHVLEPLSGYLLLGAKLWSNGPKFSGAWNFGPMDGEVWTVEDVVKEAIHCWGEGSYRVENLGNPHEAHWLKLDCSKARIELKWQPKYSVHQALTKTVHWYRQFYEDARTEEMRSLSARQIKEYMAFWA